MGGEAPRRTERVRITRRHRLSPDGPRWRRRGDPRDQALTHIQVQPRKRPLGGYGDRAGSGDGWWGSSEDAAEAGPSEAVIELVRAGNKIEAIKVHREETGLGLAEAKKAIDNL